MVQSSSSHPFIAGRLRPLLQLVFLLFALLVLNSTYLGAVTLVEYLTGDTLQDTFYLSMFLGHLALGLVLIVPVLAFGFLHMRRAHVSRNRYAVRLGIALYTTAIVLLLSGVVLTRFGFFEVNHPQLRSAAYWLHVVAPFAVAWLFILHRLAGPPIHWRTGAQWATASLGLAFALALIQFDKAEEAGLALDDEALRFAPALARTEPADGIAADHLMGDEVCAECHGDIADTFANSMHRFSSFNNPAYRFSIDEARDVVFRRDGNFDGARLCAACHDPVLLYSGRFDDPAHDFDSDPAASAGITCISCHAISSINSPRGNADYTLTDPPRYPFAHSEEPLFKSVNRQLIKAKPALHKQSFLKPVHQTAEFCSSCHKVHIPAEVNQYRWLRGQDHYDSFLLSGMSGHRVDSFYYPPQAFDRCADCHMPLMESDDPAARDFAGTGKLSVHNHQFAAGNTGVSHMLGLPREAIAAQQARMSNIARVDIFGLREQGTVDGPLRAPLGPDLPQLEPGGHYLIETVVRTSGIGHHLTQGTADSNELWLDVVVRSGDRIIGRSGGQAADGQVDPWSWFGNAYVLDKNGERLDRRNGLDMFVALYDHQVPPGAAAVVHYGLRVPEDLTGPVTVEAHLRYRKFDTTFVRYLLGDEFERNDLPITTLASDRVTLPLAGAAGAEASDQSNIPAWERWNDYGIGLLRQGRNGLRQAEEAFASVEAAGRGTGAVNLARVYFREGRLDEASAALRRAGQGDHPAEPWTVAWFSALIDRENGYLDQAIDTLEAIAQTRFEQARKRGFDFGYDTRVLNTLGRSLYERARQERGSARVGRREAYLETARDWLNRTLEIDPENAGAHHNLALVSNELGDADMAAWHREHHDRYRPDDSAVEQAVARHRAANPAADHAAEPVAVYDLQRPDAYELAKWPEQPARGGQAAGHFPVTHPSGADS